MPEDHHPRRIATLLRNQMRNLGMFAALGLALALLAVANPKYISLENFIVVALQMSFVGIAALGTAPLLISGNIDLSIGSLFALTAIVAAMLARLTHAYIAMAAAVGLGAAIGWVNGLFVWRIKLSPIIVTLGSMTIVRGTSLLLTGGFSVRDVPREFGAVGQSRWFGVPGVLWVWIALAVLVHWILSQTTIGRHLFAIGGNRNACEAVGIPVRRLVLGAFAANGAIVGLAGVLAASRFGSASPSFGTTMELDVITAAIMGGVAFTGGEGNVLGVILAVALLGVINSGIVSLGINPHYAEVVKGTALLLAVGLDQLSQEGRTRYRTMLAMRER